MNTLIRSSMIIAVLITATISETVEKYFSPFWFRFGAYFDREPDFLFGQPVDFLARRSKLEMRLDALGKDLLNCSGSNCLLSKEDVSFLVDTNSPVSAYLMSLALFKNRENLQNQHFERGLKNFLKSPRHIANMTSTFIHMEFKNRGLLSALEEKGFRPAPKALSNEIKHQEIVCERANPRDLQSCNEYLAFLNGLGK